MHILQNLVLPHLQLPASEDLYVRLSDGRAVSSLEKTNVQFLSGGQAWFDTFFNGFSVGVWKRHCQIEDLSLRFSGTGKFIIKIGLHRWGHSHRWLSEKTIDFSSTDEITIPLEFWKKLDDGILYFHLSAITDGTLRSASYITNTRPRREVRLGIVITHFNRKNYVVPAIKRLKEQLLDDPYYCKRLSLIVVDNSKNLTIEETLGATLISNENYGGAGGFTRGLLELDESKDYSHCLFMDDDASCEVESIKRCFQLLAYSVQEKFAVAGAMLREVESHRLSEKGAQFKKLCRPLKSGLDMRNVHDLLLAEKPDDLADYGGWWFFAFAIKDVEHYPFPFFVRGDDITFGLMNKFNICTMLGISVWGDDFSLKSGPMTYYLDTRYHIFLYMILFNHNPRKIIRMVWKFFYRQLTSYNYASASAITQAINHISEGPKFFRNNMKMEGVFPLIQLHPVSEKLKPVIRGEIEPIYGSGKRRRRVSRLIQKISFNGALLPNSKFKADTIVLPKGFSGDRDAIYRIRSVLYEYDPLNLGYIVSFRRDFFFREMFKYLTQVILFRLKFSWLHKEYKKELTYLTSKRFWKETYIEHGLN